MTQTVDKFCTELKSEDIFLLVLEAEHSRTLNPDEDLPREEDTLFAKGPHGPLRTGLKLFSSR
jgi:hypothetical protein